MSSIYQIITYFRQSPRPRNEARSSASSARVDWCIPPRMCASVAFKNPLSFSRMFDLTHTFYSYCFIYVDIFIIIIKINIIQIDVCNIKFDIWIIMNQWGLVYETKKTNINKHYRYVARTCMPDKLFANRKQWKKQWTYKHTF